MASDMQQQDMFPDEAVKEKPEPRQPKKMTLGPEKERGTAKTVEHTVEGIPRLVLPTRWELLQPKLGTNEVSLKTIIRPVPQAIRIIRNITEYLRTTSGCQVLVIRGDTGSGKTTFLNTLVHYMPDVDFQIQTIDLQFVEEDKFVNELEKVKLDQAGINVIILEGREKPESISERYIQVVLANINRFSRQKRLPMLFVVPTIEEQVARTWCDHGIRIGDLIPEHKLYDRHYREVFIKSNIFTSSNLERSF
jgi:hypothetical protein